MIRFVCDWLIDWLIDVMVDSLNGALFHFPGSHHALESEVDRLSDLIDRLDSKVSLVT